MEGMRELSAFCAICGEPTTHIATDADPGTCTCRICGTVQQLMVPIS